MIVRTRSGFQLELRSFSLGAQTRYGFTDLRSLSGGFSESAVRGIPALGRAARIRAEALASLRLCCWRDSENGFPQKVTNVWQARLFKGAPNDDQTRFGFWETVGESLAWRNNSYVWKMSDPLTQRVIELWALHPDQVECKGNGRYDVHVDEGYLDPVGKGRGTYANLDSRTILHIRGYGQGGTYEAPTPIQVYREALQAPLERQRYETRMWKRGTALKLAVEFPQNVNRAQAEDWRDMWRETYEGTEETTAIIGGGAQVKSIGMTAEDASYVAMAGLTADDASRIMGVPVNWINGTTLRAGLFEQDLAIWLRLGIGPDLDRVESSFSADEDLFGDAPPNAASVYPRFDTQNFVRGDLLTEAQIKVQFVQAGIWTPDEARATDGLDPLPDGLGSIPQITPVGGAPNPLLQKVPPAAVAAANGDGGDY